jgi:hypothetical protein
MRARARIFGLLLALAAAAAPCRAQAPEPNTLTPAEAAGGWSLLWDGRTTDGWRSVKDPEFPKEGWIISGGVLSTAEGGRGGDIITTRKYSDFDLTADFRVTPGANSGIKIFVDPEFNRASGRSIGFEYQILDDALNPDARNGRDGNRTLGSLYDLYPPSPDKPVNPVGSWNTALITCHGPRVEHWLNGRKILEYTRFTPEFRQRVEASKFRSVPGFGELREGYILLQDHGDVVSFRNLKIRVARPAAPAPPNP